MTIQTITCRGDDDDRVTIKHEVFNDKTGKWNWMGRLTMSAGELRIYLGMIRTGVAGALDQIELVVAQ